MSQGFGVPFEQWRLVNAMLPRVYYPPLQGNVYEVRCADIVRQLFSADDMDIDCALRAAAATPLCVLGPTAASLTRMWCWIECWGATDDQFLAKKPQKDNAVFAWHQDLA